MKASRLISVFIVLTLFMGTLTGCPTSSPSNTNPPSSSNSPPPPPPPPPPPVTVTSMTVLPGIVGIDEEATVMITVENVSDGPESYTVQLAIQGTVENTKEVTVAAQSTRDIRFRISKQEPGDYQLEAGALSATLTVKSGFYRNSTYGFSIVYPDDWLNQETTGGTLVAQIDDPTGFNRFRVILEVVSEEISAEEYAAAAASVFESLLQGFAIVSQGEVILGESTSGYEVIFDGVSNGVEARGSIVIVLSGTKVFMLSRFYDRPGFIATKDEMDTVFQSFQVEEPTLFGVPRDNSLFLWDRGPLTLDPALAGDGLSNQYISQIFSGLVTFDRNMQLVPDIAESWEISDDGTIYTFLLREAYFHNGRRVTASDFKYSMERACDPGTGSTTASTYLADIVGATDMLEGRATEISGIRVVSDYILEITIDAPKSYFLYKLAYPTAFVVDSNDIVLGDDWWLNPNGTGPFQLYEWQEDELIILESNQDFYGEPPEIEHIVFLLWGGQPMLMYEMGEIDVVKVSLADLERVLDPNNPLNQELITVTQLAMFGIGFNFTEPPFDDPKIRQAFSLAIDKDKLIELVFKDSVQRANGILPTGIPGYNEDLIGLDYDPERALQLIAESSYGSVANLPPIIFTSAGYGTVSALDAALIDMWRDNLGVEVQLRQMDPEAYYNELIEEKDQLFIYGWSADYPDPQNFLDVLFYTGSEQNNGEYSNPDIDLLLEQARVEQDNSARMQIYQLVEQMLVDDAAFLPLYYGINYLLVKPYVNDFVLSPQGVIMFRYISLEPR